ncbi:MAG: septum formation initiator family protein [Clostridium sp.]
MKKIKKKGSKIICLAIVLIFGTILIKQQSIINRLSDDYNHYVNQEESLKIQNVQLKERLAQSEHDNYGEIRAREILGMVKEGEILFIDKNRSK